MKRLLFLLLALAAVQVNAQDLALYQKIVKELSSARYQGRGYARDGANKAGKYLSKEFGKAGADEVICQPFTIDINTFDGKMKMWADGKKPRMPISSGNSGGRNEMCRASKHSNRKTQR